MSEVRTINDHVYMESFSPYEDEFFVIEQEDQKIIGRVRDDSINRLRPSAQIPDQFFDDLDVAGRFVWLVHVALPYLRALAEAPSLVGDGVTDDTAAIQAMIDLCHLKEDLLQALDKAV